MNERFYNNGHLLDYLEYHDHFVSDITDKQLRYNKTTNNLQKCITECVLPGRTIIHPYTRKRMISYKDAFCGTQSWYDHKIHKIKHHDTCRVSDAVKMAWSDVDNSAFYPMDDITCKEVYKIFRKLRSWKDCVRWEKYSGVDEVVKRKVMNCMWRRFEKDEYAKKYRNKVIKHYQSTIKEIWIDDYEVALEHLFSDDITNKKRKEWMTLNLFNDSATFNIIKQFIYDKNIDYYNIRYHDDQFKHYIRESMEDILEKNKNDNI